MLRSLWGDVNQSAEYRPPFGCDVECRGLALPVPFHLSLVGGHDVEYALHEAVGVAVVSGKLHQYLWLDRADYTKERIPNEHAALTALAVGHGYLVVEHRHPELRFRTVVVSVEVLEPPGKFIGNEAQAARILRENAVDGFGGHVLHCETLPYRFDRILFIAVGCPFFRWQFHCRIVAFECFGMECLLLRIMVKQRLHGETQRMALV